MSAEDLVARVRKGFEAFAAGDGSVLAAEFADDIEWVVPGNLPISGTKRGLEEVAAHMATLGSMIRGAEWKHFLSDGERVVVIYTLQFEQGPVDGVDVIEFRDDKIVHFQPYVDTSLIESWFNAG